MNNVSEVQMDPSPKCGKFHINPFNNLFVVEIVNWKLKMSSLKWQNHRSTVHWVHWLILSQYMKSAGGGEEESNCSGL